MKSIIIALLIVSPSGSLVAGSNYQEKLDSSIKKLRNLSSDSIISESFYFVMTDSVFPDWMGTKWDFNGISNVPSKGMIACGYFVSTTLKHVGFNLNRYRLAQQAASKVIDVLCGENKMKSVLEADIIQKLKGRGNNRLYVVGLDYHVGFLAVENDSVYFIHSDYFNGKVVCEKASESISFSSTNAYVYGELTNNPLLFTRWKNGIKIY
ncbi:MAG: hypothetical protein CMP63_06675 [Flavobacteriales bacterium]|nr:hypothetical protein [Flavobacteriales bacterium]|tara:strand:+ start:3887 stop:4513 length:627 start_codon:yes stop_codon:yes gene_type:complete